MIVGWLILGLFSWVVAKKFCLIVRILIFQQSTRRNKWVFTHVKNTFFWLSKKLCVAPKFCLIVIIVSKLQQSTSPQLNRIYITRKLEISQTTSWVFDNKSRLFKFENPKLEICQNCVMKNLEVFGIYDEPKNSTVNT